MKRLLKRLVVGGVIALVLSTSAFGYCMEPMTPRFSGYKPTEPNTPFCINKLSNTHTCSEWEIDSYNREVESYNSQLRTYQWAVDSYVDQLNAYVDDAVAYAKCEISDL